MVGRSWPILFMSVVCMLCLLPFNADSAPQLELKVKNHTVELGEAVVAELSGYDLTPSLSNIDISPLDTNFGVEVEETSSAYVDQDSRHKLREIILLKLYPRTMGEITVPALQLNGVATKVTTVQVESAKVRNSIILLDWNISDSSPWERQQVIVQAKVLTSERFAVLDSELERIPGMELIRLPAEKKRLDSSAGSKIQLIIGWIIFPQTSGIYTINLPVINYQVGGLVSRRFYLPKITLNVKALPPYIPPTMPVGKVDIASKLVSDTLLKTDIIANWEVTLHSAVLVPQRLPAVLRQVESANDFKILPIESSRSTDPDKTGVNGKVIHRIPFQPQHFGKLELPSIRVQYFDPETERLVTRNTREISVYAFHPVVIWLAKLAVLAIFTLLGWIAINGLINFKKRRRQIHYAIHIVAHADTIYTLRSGLKLYAKAMQWPENNTLTAWLACWQKQFDCNAELANLIQELTRACYSKDSYVKLDSLRKGFITYLRSPGLVQTGITFLSTLILSTRKEY